MEAEAEAYMGEGDRPDSAGLQHPVPQREPAGSPDREPLPHKQGGADEVGKLSACEVSGGAQAGYEDKGGTEATNN